MAGVAQAASNTCSQQEVTVDKGRTEEVIISPRSTLPTSTIDTTVASSRSLRHQGLTAGQSMVSQGSDREKKEHISKEQSPKVGLAATSGAIINGEEKCGDPDTDKITPPVSSVVVPTVVVPSVIRVSPLAPGKASAETDFRDSSRIVPVVRPFAVKTSQQAPNVRGELDPEPVSTQVSVPAEHAVHRNEASGKKDRKGSVQQQHQQASAKGVGRSDTPTPHIDEIKRRQEAQVAFPARVPAREHPEHIPRASERRAVMSREHGQQGPSQNVHGRQHHSHGRAASNRAPSLTSSVDGPPMLTPRGARGRRGMSASSHENDSSDMSPSLHPEPLFQRLVTEEVQELKHYTRIIEEQNHRLNEVENITDDLDRKLQKQTKARTDLERTLELRERQWADKFEKLEAERDHWKEVVQQEKRMNTRLNDQVARMEQEIHRMLQRKYDHQRGENVHPSVRTTIRLHGTERNSPVFSTSTSSKNSPSSPAHVDRKKEQFTSPREILKNDGSVEVVRKRNVSGSLLDFFGM